MNTYNAAIQYLMNKYGRKRLGHTSKFQRKLNEATSQIEKKQLLDNATDNDYICSVNEDAIPKDKGNDHAILLLLDQYFTGNAPKKDLENYLAKVGVTEK